jgi:hypothetical protein
MCERVSPGVDARAALPAAQRGLTPAALSGLTASPAVATLSAASLIGCLPFGLFPDLLGEIQPDADLLNHPKLAFEPVDVMLLVDEDSLE